MTFGDLWSAPAYEGEDQKAAEFRCVAQPKRAINFEVMTTNLTLGCPSRIPVDSKGFHFSSREWAKFFSHRSSRLDGEAPSCERENATQCRRRASSIAT